jgi:hypothetical protein
VAKQRSTFGKLERARAKQAKAQAKRDHRSAPVGVQVAAADEDDPGRKPAVADQADILNKFAQLQADFDDGRMTLDDFEAKRNELRSQLLID